MYLPEFTTRYQYNLLEDRFFFCKLFINNQQQYNHHLQHFLYKLFIIFLNIIIIYKRMINKYKNNGLAMSHNFRNRYLDDQQLQKPTSEQAQIIHDKTQNKINQIIGIKTEAAHGTYLNRLKNTQAQIIRFTSKDANGELGQTQRIVKIQNLQMDPLLPPRYKHRKVPRGPPSPPPQVLRSPPRKLTQKDMQDWKVPPCISNWRNSKGYTIPLHMRLSADGRSLQHNTINEHFADNIDSLYIAQRQARSQIEERSKIQKSVAYKQYLKKEEDLRNAAIKARQEKIKLMEEAGSEQSQQANVKQREEIRYIRARELEREERLKKVGSKKNKQIRDKERDISQKVALGQAQPTKSDVMYDERLFNNSAGMEPGLTHDDDDNVYDKPLFADRSAVNLYNVKQTPDEGEEQTLMKGKQNLRKEPVKFQKHKDDIFGLDSFVTDKVTKKVKKQ